YALSFLGSCISAPYAIVLGHKSIVTGEKGISIGYNRRASKNTISLGNRSGLNSAGESCIFIGDTCGDLGTFTNEGTVAIGVGTARNVTSGTRNVIIGRDAGNTVTTGSRNVIIGAGANVLSAGSDECFSLGTSARSDGGGVAIGGSSRTIGGISIGGSSGAGSSGTRNICIGSSSGSGGISGIDNICIGGINTGNKITSGNNNIVFGAGGASALTTGYYNTILNTQASTLISGARNVIIGNANNTTTSNTVRGVCIGYNSVTGNFGVAIGDRARADGYSVSIGSYAARGSTSQRSVSIGNYSGGLYNTGNNNTCVGTYSGRYMSFSATSNTLIGYNAGRSITSGTFNTCIGSNAGNTLNLYNQTSVVCIGRNAGQAAGGLLPNYSWWTNPAIPSVGTQVALHINTTTGQIGPVSSTLKTKKDVENLEETLTNKFINEARPVRFKWKDSNKPGIGFIAEEMNLIVPEVVPLNANGEPVAINYELLVAVLTQSIQKLTSKINTLESRVTELESQ
ncbi:MAG: tail fiber domain-containing protein, partial [Candidatus Paceibacterota bacterium]